MLGIALWGDDKIWRSIQCGFVGRIIDGTVSAPIACGTCPCQLVGSLPSGIVLVEASVFAVVGEAHKAVLPVPAHLSGAPLLEMIVGGHIACQIVEQII